jgi:Mce-associated membrane protein
MPSGKKLRTAKPEPEASQDVAVDDEVAVEDPAEDSAEAVELTTPTVDETPAEEPAAKQERKRSFLRRRKKNKPEAGAADVAATTEDVPAQEKSDDEPVEAEASVEDTVDEATETAPVAEDEGESEAAVDEAAVEDEAVVEEPVLVPHRPAGKRLKVVAAATAALFVAGGAFLGATAQPVIANNAMVETKLNIARTAANAITTLWSYTPENMDSLGQRSAGYLTGDFAFQYKKFIDSIAATNKQAQVTNTTTVLGTAVESVTPTDASAVVYTNSIATSPVSKNIPSLRYLSYRLEMKRDRTDWRITRMTTVTTLDLTPQI